MTLVERPGQAAAARGERRVPGTGAELAVAALAANGVETVFGIPGVHTLALYDALQGSSIRHVLARHEQGAGFMADGYARAGGRPGVAAVITGPGVTNVATPIGEAYTDSSPVLVLSSNVDRAYVDRMRGNLHDLKDQLGVMAAVTQWNARVARAADGPGAIAEAFRRLGRGRPRPVHVEFPLDVFDEWGESDIEIAEVAPPEPDRGAIEAAAQRLTELRRPAIYAGGGAVAAGAGPALVALAERLGALETA
jgi:thiamine pyrophosphate-dependent acetolactate synthase large subunit-like protein